MKFRLMVDFFLSTATNSIPFLYRQKRNPKNDRRQNYTVFFHLFASGLSGTPYGRPKGLVLKLRHAHCIQEPGNFEPAAPGVLAENPNCKLLSVFL